MVVVEDGLPSSLLRSKMPSTRRLSARAVDGGERFSYTGRSFLHFSLAHTEQAKGGLNMRFAGVFAGGFSHDGNDL
jgi:hypothetical protein